MKVAEYVALGQPVICSGIATMRDYFSDDELLFFEPGNAEDLARAIRDLLADPAAAGERAARSRLRLDKLDWPAQKVSLVETVEALAGSGNRIHRVKRGRAALWSARFTECKSQARKTRR
jgi:glycogen(starch) synthase